MSNDHEIPPFPASEIRLEKTIGEDGKEVMKAAGPGAEAFNQYMVALFGLRKDQPEECRDHGIQNCHTCPCAWCGDNANPELKP